MKEYMGYKVGDKVKNGSDIYLITAITKQRDAKYFSLRGVNVERSIFIHEWVMKNYPLVVSSI